MVCSAFSELFVEVYMLLWKHVFGLEFESLGKM